MAGRAVALGGVAAGLALLLARAMPDVGGRPLFEDEAVAGLIAARPVGEILLTVLWDRGGAPLHFLLAHVAFQVDGSAETLRWLSVVFAAATIPLAFDLGRRLAGPVAGSTAAVVAGASGLLGIYGSFGRMYALLAFAGALAADTFLRALDERTARAATWAAAAAWLLPAVHPYGGLVLAVEAAVALAVWRGRPLRPALPVLAIGLATLPFLVGDLRLAGRFEVAGEAEGKLATSREAWDLFVRALGGFAGGEGLLLAFFAALAVAGAALAARRSAPFVVFAAVSLALPAVLVALVPTSRAPDLSPRHLIFALPVWAAFAGVGVAAATARRPVAAQAAAVAAVGALAVLAPDGVDDPRSVTYTAALGSREAVAEPAAWLREETAAGDALYPYASVFLAALPEAGRGVGLPRAQSQSLLAAARRLDYPVGAVLVSVPTGTTSAAPVEGGRQFDRWLLVRREGPFATPADVLAAAAVALADSRAALTGPVPAPLAGWFGLNRAVLCESLAELGEPCPRR